MNKTFKKDLFKTKDESVPEKTALKSEFVWTREPTKPDNASEYNIKKYEVKTNVERYYKGVKLHNYLIFGMPALPESQYFLYLLHADKQVCIFRKAYIFLYFPLPDCSHLF